MKARITEKVQINCAYHAFAFLAQVTLNKQQYKREWTAKILHDLDLKQRWDCFFQIANCSYPARSKT